MDDFDVVVEKETKRIIRKVNKALLKIEPLDGGCVYRLVAFSLIIHLLGDSETYGLTNEYLSTALGFGVRNANFGSIDERLTFFEKAKSELLEIYKREDNAAPC